MSSLSLPDGPASPRPDAAASPPELWGGIECTIARVGDEFRDQIGETGHRHRLGDLEAIASLGLKRIRYPVLWESVSPEDPDASDWTWHDERLRTLKDLGLSPIAGLVHHGSGPRYTSLLDPGFPDLLERHAERVAARYPWIDHFTPVNEPLTTARFSGLYGHWYPHGREAASFLRALVTQCRGVVLAMRAIRRITPGARLVQTEDLGRTFSTPLLRYQADFENHRRWLSLDLLCGVVDRSHPLYRYLTDHGVSESEIAFFREAGCAPDIIGINHYLTSDRFLDQRLGRYPEGLHGGNGSHCYADVEAVRADLAPGSVGPEARLREAWARYRRPLAVTEAHHGCTREEQLRWFVEVWTAASALKAEGADIRAVTLWSLFGAVDWNSLLVRRSGFYEPGAFDIRSDPPRPTILARAAAALSGGVDFGHPVLDVPGWWRRDARFYHPPRRVRTASPPVTKTERRLLVTGASGMLGGTASRICRDRGLKHVALSRTELDIADRAAVDSILDTIRPWAVVNAAGQARVGNAEQERDRCFRSNTEAAEALAAACATRDLPLVTFSSHHVFDGRLGRPYVESDEVHPVCILGESKVEGERRTARAHPGALVIRTSNLFGPSHPSSFAHDLVNALSAGRPIRVVEAALSPTYLPDLVHAALDLLIDGESGVWHLANSGVTSLIEFLERLAFVAPLDRSLIAEDCTRSGTVLALTSERALLMPSIESALDRFVRDYRLDTKPPTARCTRNRRQGAITGRPPAVSNPPRADSVLLT